MSWGADNEDDVKRLNKEYPYNIERGIYPNLSNEEYHGHKGSISRSAIMDYMESPYLYWAKHINPKRRPRESTKAMDFGNAFHTFVLESEKFLDQYAFAPEKVTLKYSSREAYDEYKREIERLENSDKIVISDQDGNLLLDMRQALRDHKEAWELIQGGIYEQSYFWQDKESGLLLKSRPDILHSNMYVDLKTCVSASTRAYQRAMVDGGLHIQAALVVDAVRELEGREIQACINICCEKQYPYIVAIKIIGEKAIEEGRRKYKSILLKIKKSIEENEWSSYEPETVELPVWAS